MIHERMTDKVEGPDLRISNIHLQWKPRKMFADTEKFCGTEQQITTTTTKTPWNSENSCSKDYTEDPTEVKETVISGQGKRVLQERGSA